MEQLYSLIQEKFGETIKGLTVDTFEGMYRQIIIKHQLVRDQLQNSPAVQAGLDVRQMIDENDTGDSFLQAVRDAANP